LKVAEGTKTPTYLNLAAPESFGPGERVFTIGYLAREIVGGEARVTEGVISSLSVGGNAGYMQIEWHLKDCTGASQDCCEYRGIDESCGICMLKAKAYTVGGASNLGQRILARGVLSSPRRTPTIPC
jgi:hypothetical protein